MAASEGDLETLRLFNDKIDRLRTGSFARRMFTQKSGFTLNYRAGEPITAEVSGPDQEAIDAMVLTLRLTMQNNDRISIARMADVVARYEDDSEAVARFTDARTKLNHFLAEPTVPTLNVNGDDLRNGQILRGVVYGELAHLDEKKAKAMTSLRSNPWMSALIDNAFNTIVAQLLSFLFYLQIQNQTLYRDLTGEELHITWPEVSDDKQVV